MAREVIKITYYTDPYCTWCWGSEPVIRHLKEAYGDQVRIVYKMGGLVEDMENFYDAHNQISTMAQVAPHWLEASHRHGMPVDETVFTDPDNDFHSTYPANIAFKAAQFQSEELAERFLRRMREAASCEHQFIHKKEVQAALAESVGLDKDRLLNDIGSGRARDAFKEDLTEARSKGIAGFPTFILTGNEDEIVLHGYRPFDVFDSAIKKLCEKDLRKTQPTDIPSFVGRWKRVTTQEIAEVFELTRAQSMEHLVELEKEGRLRKIPVGNGELWEVKSAA